VQRTVPLFITFIAGIFMILGLFFPAHLFKDPQDKLQELGLMILAAATLLGIANLVRINATRIQRRERDWPYKIVLLASLFLMFGVGMVKFWVLDYNATKAGTFFNDRLYESVYVPTQSTMFALLAFFIASAAFRAFRIRTPEAVVLAIAGGLVMLGRVPLGNALIWPTPPGGFGASEVADWLMNVPTLAARRAIFIGAALGAISIGLRVILGLERAHLGSGE
jgi:hypothetical protein